MTERGRAREDALRVVGALSGYVERGEVPGLVVAMSRGDDVQVECLGRMSVQPPKPMSRDTLFRIASMTKPVIAVATLILAEEGKVRLDEPVNRLLPEWADPRVLRRPDSSLDDVEPARRAITVRDLLTFRLGTGLVVGPPDALPIQRALRERQVMTALPNPPSPLAPDEWMRRLGELPLVHQPGEVWMYHIGSDVLGVLIARASGQPLARFLEERVFDPLGMKDTAFTVPPGKSDRLAACYRAHPETGALEAYDDGRDWSEPPAFPSGGGGLVSTADDTLAFGRMLLNGGEHGAKRLLSRSSVQAMTTDHLTSAQKTASPLFPGFWDTRGWGFGVATMARPDGNPAVPGRFGWDGGFGTSWSSDPAESLVAILLIQRLGFPPVTDINRDFWRSVYASGD